MKGLGIALAFLTRLPIPALGAVSDAGFAASMRWFPAAGLAVGGVVAATAWAGSHVDAWTGALLALAAWIAVTGALHLDGLGDVADAAGAAHRDPARLLAVMADPHLGSFGAVVIGTQLLAKLVLLHAAIVHGAWAGLLLVPAAARWGPLAWSYALPPLGHGLGARFAGVVRRRDLFGWLALGAAAASAVPALLATPVLVAAWGWWLRCRLGGISGDGHGAGIELVESGLLLVLACVR